MGSFVPFGGFFSTPEIRSPLNSSTNGSFTRCDKCTEKCEQEVADILKVGPSSSNSTSSPWLQKIVNVDTHRGLDVAKVCMIANYCISLLQCILRDHMHIQRTSNMVGQFLYYLYTV